MEIFLSMHRQSSFFASDSRQWDDFGFLFLARVALSVSQKLQNALGIRIHACLCKTILFWWQRFDARRGFQSY